MDTDSSMRAVKGSLGHSFAEEIDDLQVCG
jgi:hypothetical protein